MKKSFEELREKVTEQLEGVVSQAGGRNFRLNHLERTFKNCEKILEFEEVESKNPDREVVLTAALFHDIGCINHVNNENMLDPDLKKNYKKSHEALSAEWVVENIDMGRKFLEKVAGVIGGHHREKPERVETEVLQDADNLDEVGNIGVWRALTYAGYQKISLREELEFWKKKKEDLKKIVDNMNFKEVEEIARKRLKRMNVFMKNLEKEMESEF